MQTLRHSGWLVVAVLVLVALAACQPVMLDAATPSATGTATSSTGISTTQPSGAGMVEANGITLAYESFGAAEDETILLIGGTGMQLVDWPRELIDGLVDQGYRVVRFDNRDIGLSTKFTEAGPPDEAAIGAALQAGEPVPFPYTLRDMAADAVGLLDALAIDRAHIVGISMGGDIAQLVAIDYPERTLSLTLIAADSGNPAIPVVADPAAFEGVPPLPDTVDHDAFVAWQVATWQALAGESYPTDAATLQAEAERDFARNFDPAAMKRQQMVSFLGHFEPDNYRLEHLATITAPAVVVQGSDDPLVPVAAAEDIVARVPNAEYRLLPGLGHHLPTALLPEFIDAITTAAQRAG